MYAIIETGGKQYRVSEGQVLKIEKIDASPGDSINLDRVLLMRRDEAVTVGNPYIEGANVKASVIETAKDGKIMVFKKKPRKGFKRLKGHRQLYTKIKIDDIQFGG
jgi:large subunit ribosomal protein L21